MSSLRPVAVAPLLLGLLTGPGATGAQPWTETEEAAADRLSREPSIDLTRLGPVDVGEERRIELAEAIVELAGQVWGHGPGDSVAVLLKPIGSGPWSVAASGRAPPGGLFQIPGIRFPDSGNHELVACLFRQWDLPADGTTVDGGCGDGALAASRELLVRLAAPPAPSPAERPGLEVVSVGGVSLDPYGVTPVPARGEVVLAGRGFPANIRFYLALFAPYSDRGYLHGPAHPGSGAGLSTVHGVPLEVPGDPRSARLELIAVASPEPLATGPLSLSSLRRREAQTSPTVEVVVDRKGETGNSFRVPHLAVTRIGDHLLEGVPPQKPLDVEPGGAIEVGRYERVPEGAQVWILTRPRGGDLWLAQGPAVLRGGRSPEDPLRGPPQVTWLWPSTRFEHPDPGSRPRRNRQMREEFEVRAVLAIDTLPNDWIHSASLSSYFIQTSSELVRVRAVAGEPLPDLQLSISRVGARAVAADDEIPVAAAERVEISARQELPPSLRLYLARHKAGSSLWTVSETIPRGKSYLEPEVSFVNPHPQEGARYQLMAVATRGVLPAGQLEYEDLVRAAVAVSDVVTVRHQAGGLSGFTSRLARWWTGGARSTREQAADNESKGAENMPEPPGARILWTLLLGAMVFLAFAVTLEWGLGIVSSLARSAANRTERALRASRGWFSEAPPINPAHLLLGVIILSFVSYALTRYYLPLLGKAVEEVTGLTWRESSGLAFWVVLFTALAGTLLEQSSQRTVSADAMDTSSHPGGPRSFGLRLFLGVILFFLMTFQAAFYSTFLNRTAGGLVALLGGVAFFLIAFIEAMAFFFVTKLSLVPLASLALRLARAPFVLTVLFFRFVETLFDSIPKREPKGVPPTPRREATSSS